MAERTEKSVTLHRWDDVTREQVTDQFARRLIWGDKVMLAQVFLDAGAIVPKHSHENEQISYVIRGVLRFWVGDDDRMIDVHAGEVLEIPSNVPHRAEAIEEMMALDVFSPPRWDWIEKTDDYLRKK